MSSFTQPLSFESTDRFVGGTEAYRTIDGEPYVLISGARRIMRVLKSFKYEDEKTGYSFIVPSGFETDLGSIPSIVQSYVQPDAPYAQAFVLHDFLYDQLRKGRLPKLTRKDADNALLAALALPFQVSRNDKTLRALCPVLTRNLIYAAVRAGGKL